ncbi:hypothetical protein KCP77_16560 [Salmonella enterica subsp. enterica]|nr:hypothetical protein KCP77_16560 [Salmonella enterica subsp. enterica]
MIRRFASHVHPERRYYRHGFAFCCRLWSCRSTPALKLDKPLLEAARLGAGKMQTFIRIIIPLTMPGIVADLRARDATGNGPVLRLCDLQWVARKTCLVKTSLRYGSEYSRLAVWRGYQHYADHCDGGSCC